MTGREFKNHSLLIYTGLPPAAQEDNSAAAKIAEELRADAEAAARDTDTCLAAKEAQVADLMQRLADAHVDAGAKAVNLESQVRFMILNALAASAYGLAGTGLDVRGVTEGDLSS